METDGGGWIAIQQGITNGRMNALKWRISAHALLKRGKYTEDLWAKDGDLGEKSSLLYSESYSR